MSLPTIAGVAAALGAGAAFGICGILQYRAVHEVPDEAPGRPRLLVKLVQRPLWRWSIVLAATAFALQVVALRFAPVAIVQPLLVTSVLWYVSLTAAILKRRFDRTLVVGMSLCLGGLSAFLISAQPSAGGPRAATATIVIVVFALALLTTLALLSVPVVGRQWRAIPLALAAGACYGATASLIRGLSAHFEGGIGEILHHWETYAIAIIGPIGVLLNQNSYQSGRAGASALTIITVIDPLVSIVLGVVWLGESLRNRTWSLAGEVIGMAAVIYGVALVAARSPRASVQDSASVTEAPSKVPSREA